MTKLTIMNKKYKNLHGNRIELALMWCSTHHDFHLVLCSINERKKTVVTGELSSLEDVKELIKNLQTHLDFLQSPDKQMAYIERINAEIKDKPNQKVIFTLGE